MDRRTFLHDVAAGAAGTGPRPRRASSARDTDRGLDRVRAEVGKRHDEAVRAAAGLDPPAVDRGREPRDGGGLRAPDPDADATRASSTRGARPDRRPARRLRDARRRGAPRTVGLYFMYDVKQVDPAEWSSPPFEAAIVEKPGPRARSSSAAAPSTRRARSRRSSRRSTPTAAPGAKLPVNLVLVAEGEEEIGSPHFPQIVRRPEVAAALARCSGIFMPSRGAGPGRRRDGHPRRQGRHRVRADLERRALGPRADEGHPLEQQGARRQPGLAPRPGARTRSSAPTATRRRSRASPTGRGRSRRPRRR